jgi:hypothetical protein
VHGGRFWILDFGFWILDFGFWILDFGFWILDFGFWILDCDYSVCVLVRCARAEIAVLSQPE